MQKCKYCGRSIKFRKINGVSYAVEAKEVCFLPDPNGRRQFVSRFGALIRGEPVSDGQYGNAVHCCTSMQSVGTPTAKQTSLY